MLRVRVCAAHIGEFWGPNSLNKGPFRQTFPKYGWVWPKFAKKSLKIGNFPRKFIIKVGMNTSFGNKNRAVF